MYELDFVKLVQVNLNYIQDLASASYHPNTGEMKRDVANFNLHRIGEIAKSLQRVASAMKVEGK
jgi:uncharacterized protein with HEPN domain